MRAIHDPVIAKIPTSHLDLIDGPYLATLSTVMPAGQPQTTPIWCNRKGDLILINVMSGCRKERNMRLNPKVTLFVYDPKDPQHNIEIRGLVVEMTEEGAMDHNDELARFYLNNAGAKFFGDAVSADLENKFTPIRVSIAPLHIRVEG